ncbi:MAG: glycosyltransferase [Candidatus Binataceae bacterium]
MGGSGQRAVVLLGMHRSGTSLIARGLKALGVELGEDLLPALADNPTGFWEDAAINNMNERLLASMGRVWHSIASIPSEAWNSGELQAFKLEAVEIIRTHFRSYPLWGFKDPRAARLLPFWQEVLRHLDVATSYVLIIRNPISVARSLRVRNQFAFEKSYILWLEHTVEAFAHTRGMPRVVVDYDALMADPAEQLRRIAERLALPSDPSVKGAIKDYVCGFLDKGLRHSAFDPADVYLDVHAPDLVSTAYDVLRKVALDRLDADSQEVQSALSSARSGLERFGPFFLYSDLLEEERNSIQRDFEKVRARSEDLTGEVASLRESIVGIEAERKAESSERDRQSAELAEALHLAQSACDEVRSALGIAESTLSEKDRQNAELAEALQLAQSARDQAHSALEIAESRLSERDQQSARLAEALQVAQSARDSAHSALEITESKLSERDRQNTELAEALLLAQSARDDAHSALGIAESKLSERDRQNAKLDEEVRRAEDELARTRNELQRDLIRLDVLTAEKQALFATTESLRVDQETLRSESEALKRRARLLADANAILRPELHNLWHSWSWRLFRPLRNFVRKLKGFGKETEPILDFEPEVFDTVITIRQSVSWELTAPLRLIYRFLRPRRRFTPPGRVPPAGGETIPLERKPEHNDNADNSLHYALDTDLSQPFTVGKGNVLYLVGWCFHPDRKIRRLNLLVDGVPHRIHNYGLARADVFEACAPHDDHTGSSINSGFYIRLPVEKVSVQHLVGLKLLAIAGIGKRYEVTLPSLTVQPIQTEIPTPPSVEPPAAKCGPLVAICMATYNPSFGLFTKQLDSIRQQMHENWVCIINDDCSLPHIYKKIEEIAKQDKRIFVYRNSERKGFYRNFEVCLGRVPPNAEFVALSDQDDFWHSDKLATCIAAFQPETTLVYCDMNLVDKDGALLSSTYWTERKNNYTHFTTMLIANTVTGSACMFRSSLLPDILPFPPRFDDLYHDHWIAGVAMAKGRLGYVNQSLQDYVQHSSNVIGQWHPPTATGFRLPRMRDAWKDRRSLKDRLFLSLWDQRQIYYHNVLRISVMAETIQMRIATLSGGRRFVVSQFAKADRNLRVFAGFGLLHRLRRRSTFGIEWYCLRAVVGYRLLNLHYRRARRRLMRAKLRSQIIASVAQVPAASSSSGTEPAAEAFVRTSFLRTKTAPLKLDITPGSDRRVNILVPQIDFRYLFGGYLAVFSLALKLSDSGYRTRIVLVDECDYKLELWRKEIKGYPPLADLFDRVEVEYLFDRSQSLVVSPTDAFLATSWWTAHIAHHAAAELGQHRFVYLTQEYEPLFYEASSLRALAEESYTFPHYALFSTEFLREYSRQNRIGVFAGSDGSGDDYSVSFQNAIGGAGVSLERLKRRTTRRLLFYARTESHAARNLFELGVLGLSEAIREGHFDLKKWQFDGIGSLGALGAVDLGEQSKLTLLQRTTLEEYTNLLTVYDLGLSLMLSPHPSLVPLDMAAAGLVTVTNTYANKTAPKLASISSNIIAVPATVNGIKEGLVRALSNVEDFESRVTGAQIHWHTRWSDALGGAVMDKLKGFIDHPNAN